MPVPFPADWSAVVVPAVAACARIAAAVAVAAVPLGAVVPLRARAAVVVALAAVSVPQAVAAPAAAVPPLALVSEAAVGVGLGLIAAAALAAAAAAGGIVGSLAGLSWADDFAPEGDPQTGALARLAWWLGLAGFFGAGGHLAVVAGLVESFRAVPLGTPPAAIAAVVIEAPGYAVGLALALAGPAVVAVVTFHLAAATCGRAVGFLPGPGLLQAAAAAVALAIVLAGLPTWLDGCGTTVRHRIEDRLSAAVILAP